jgi:hypothetical protein
MGQPKRPFIYEQTDSTTAVLLNLVLNLDLVCIDYTVFLAARKSMHDSRAAPPRGFDSLPSLSDDGTVSFR